MSIALALSSPTREPPRSTTSTLYNHIGQLVNQFRTYSVGTAMGRLREQRPVAFNDVNFRIKTCDDPRCQQGWHGKGIDCVAAELVCPKDATAAWVAEFHRNKISVAIAPQMARGDIKWPEATY